MSVQLRRMAMLRFDERRNYLKHLRADNGDLPESSDRSAEGHPDQSRLSSRQRREL